MDKHKFTIELTWNDDSNTYFDVTLEGDEHQYMALLMWITRGTLMASSAIKSVAYNEDGFDVCSYVR